MSRVSAWTAGLALVAGLATAQAGGQYQYPFQNPNLSMEERVTNIISLLTPEEKGRRPGSELLSEQKRSSFLVPSGDPRLQPGGRPARNGARQIRQPNAVPTTTFIQSIGLGEMWDRDLLQKVAAAEGYEARWLKQTQRYRRSSSQSLVIRAPNADFGRDIRWGRTEECYGEDACLNGTLTAAFVRGLQGNDPNYWQTAALLKHFLANSNEKGRFTECLHGVVQSRGFAPSTAGASRSTQRSPGPSRCYHQIPSLPFRLDHSWRSPPGRTG